MDFSWKCLFRKFAKRSSFCWLENLSGNEVLLCLLSPDFYRFLEKKNLRSGTKKRGFALLKSTSCFFRKYAKKQVAV